MDLVPGWNAPIWVRADLRAWTVTAGLAPGGSGNSGRTACEPLYGRADVPRRHTAACYSFTPLCASASNASSMDMHLAHGPSGPSSGVINRRAFSSSIAL